MPESAPAHKNNSLICLEIVVGLRGFRWKCQRASARELVPCQFSGADEKRIWSERLAEENIEGDYEE